MELLFFASIGDASRCETICELWDIDVRDRGCCDYDKRTPLCALLLKVLHCMSRSGKPLQYTMIACAANQLASSNLSLQMHGVLYA